MSQSASRTPGNDRKRQGSDSRVPLDPRLQRMIELAKGYDEQGTQPAPTPHASEPEHSPATLETLLCRAIIRARDSGRITQTELATKLGVAPSQITHWVRGYRHIPVRYQVELLRLMEMELRTELLASLLELDVPLSDEDIGLARLVAGLNDEAKAPLARLLNRLQA